MTESTTSSPHDAVFKTFMFTPETARDFLEIQALLNKSDFG